MHSTFVLVPHCMVSSDLIYAEDYDDGLGDGVIWSRPPAHDFELPT